MSNIEIKPLSEQAHVAIKRCSFSNLIRQLGFLSDKQMNVYLASKQQQHNNKEICMTNVLKGPIIQGNFFL